MNQKAHASNNTSHSERQAIKGQAKAWRKITDL